MWRDGETAGEPQKHGWGGEKGHARTALDSHDSALDFWKGEFIPMTRDDKVGIQDDLYAAAVGAARYRRDHGLDRLTPRQRTEPVGIAHDSVLFVCFVLLLRVVPSASPWLSLSRRRLESGGKLTLSGLRRHRTSSLRRLLRAPCKEHGH